MSWTAKYSKNIKQTGATKDASWQNLANIGNDSTKYANVQIQGNKGTSPKAKVIATNDYRFNLPSNSVVKKIVVTYRHRKTEKANIPAPTITVKGIGKSKKGSAPTTTSKTGTVSFTGLWNASVVNSNTFGVNLEYPKNANNTLSDLRLRFLYVTVYYYTPSFSIGCQSATTGTVLNKSEYRLRVSLSDANLTGKSSNVSISVPSGFTYKSSTGNGRVVRNQALSLTWVPVMNAKSKSASVELVFDVNVTFGSGVSRVEKTFVSSLQGSSGGSVPFKVVVNKELPVVDEEATGESSEEDTGKGESDLTLITVDEPTDLVLKISDQTWEEIIQMIYDKGVEWEWWTDPIEEVRDEIIEKNYLMFWEGSSYLYHLSERRKLRWYDARQIYHPIWTADAMFVPMKDCEETRTAILPQVKGISIGEDAIYLSWWYNKGGSGPGWNRDEDPIYKWQFIIRPQESSLTVPFLTRLDPTNEETDRLGHEHGYTIQSNISTNGKITPINDTTTHTHTGETGIYKTRITTITNYKNKLLLEFDLTADASLDPYNAFINLSSITPYEDDTIFPTGTIGIGYDDDDIPTIWIKNNEGETQTYTGSEDSSEWKHFKIVKEDDSFSFYYGEDNLITTQTITWFDNNTEYYLDLGNSGSLMNSYVKNIYLQWGDGETYIRDWYKNFRIGVFNNRIEANCTDYNNFDTMDTEQERKLTIPTTQDLTDCSLIISTDKAITITIDETTYELSDNDSETITDLTEYYLTALLSKVEEDTVNLTLTLKDSEETVIGVNRYILRFEQEETLEPYSTTTDTTDYDTLTDSDIFYNAEYWAETCAGLIQPNNVECEFTYNENYPLHILITGDYPEGDQENNPIKFTEPCIIETTEYTQRQPNGTFPVPIKSTLTTEEFTEVNLDAFNQTNKIIFYQLPLEEDYGTDTEKAIRGIELIGEIEQTDELVLYAKLISPNGASRERSIVLDEYEGNQQTFSIGGNGDLWGFSTLDIVELEDWEVELTVSNVLSETEGNLLFNDVQLILYVETVDTQQVKCSIDGEDISYYGAFLTDLTIPEGLETDTAFLSIDGTDTNDAYRQNIREKTITIEFDIGNNCDIEANTLSLREFTKLLVNDRDDYNRPIPKRIEFSHYPDVYWEYIMEKPFDTELDIGTYHIKATLTIPAGTSYDRNTTTTSNNGYVNGIATINPTIIIKPTSELITITEELTGQEFHITYNGEWGNNILEIDCDNRICWMKTDEDDDEPVNMNKYVDFNSSWFRLKGEYSFTGTGCIVRTVDYAERW